MQMPPKAIYPILHPASVNPETTATSQATPSIQAAPKPQPQPQQPQHTPSYLPQTVGGAGAAPYDEPRHLSPTSAAITPFQEKHMVESLDVGANDPERTVVFYTMLNQGMKRGKETKILALDCERILTKKGERLARVSIVNWYGNVVFDTLIKPWAKVVDYREWITGIRAADLKHAPSYPKVAPLLKKILDGKTIVGHSLKADFEYLKLNEDEYSCEIRDISEASLFQRQPALAPSPSQLLAMYLQDPEDLQALQQQQSSPLRNPFLPQKRKLKDLACEFLNAKIQEGHHSSIIDARVALALYRSYQLYIDQEQAKRDFVQDALCCPPHGHHHHHQQQHPQDILTGFDLSPITHMTPRMLLEKKSSGQDFSAIQPPAESRIHDGESRHGKPLGEAEGGKGVADFMVEMVIGTGRCFGDDQQENGSELGMQEGLTGREQAHSLIEGDQDLDWLN